MARISVGTLSAFLSLLRRIVGCHRRETLVARNLGSPQPDGFGEICLNGRGRSDPQGLERGQKRENVIDSHAVRSD